MSDALKQFTAFPTPVADAACAAFASVTIPLLARVSESSRATDLAIAISPPLLAVVRCVERAVPRDYTDLATMRAAGDFAWVGLVFAEQLSADEPNRIEAFHVSDLPRLIARLQELQRAAAS